MNNEYAHLNTDENPVDDILKILRDCRQLHPHDTEDKIQRLEGLFIRKKKSDYTQEEKDLVAKLNTAKEIINKLDPFSQNTAEYWMYFKQLEKSLIDMQGNFLNKYMKAG